MFGVLPHQFLSFALDLVHVGNHVLDGAKLGDEFFRCLAAHARNARNIVRSIALQTEYFHYLIHALHAPTLQHLRYAHDFHVVAHECWLVQVHVLLHQLAVILVGSHHEYLEIFAGGAGGNGAYDVVGLKTFQHQHRDVHGLEKFLGVWNGNGNVFGLGLPLGLISLVGHVPEGGGRRIVGHGNVGGPFLAQHIEQRVGETQNGAGIEAVGSDARVFAEREVCPVDQRHRVEQEKFLLWLWHGLVVGNLIR